MFTNHMMNIWLDGMMGLIVGDALGVPVQFMEKEEIIIRVRILPPADAQTKIPTVMDH